MTAKDLADAVFALRSLSNANMKQLGDPEFVGKLQAKAYGACLSLEAQLRDIEVELDVA